MNKTTITILSITLITIVGWIVFEIVHSQMVVDYPDDYKNLESIDSYFDINLIKTVYSKRNNDLYQKFQEE